MSYQIHDLSNGRQEIRASSQRSSQIIRREDGWTVAEDEHDRVFPTRADALDCARELAGDPDLRTLTQM
jgi:hypothetical protein